MPSLPVVQATGLNTSPNQLGLEDGSLTTAKNVIIRRDNVIESRRGMRLYGTPFGFDTARAKQIMEYRNRIIRYFDTTLQYDTEVENADGQSIFNTFAGSYTEVEPGLRIKSIEANSNLYFTTNDGIKKISATGADQFTTDPGYIVNAGGIKALDLSTRLNVTQGSSTGFLPVDSTVAYRVLWSYRDANNNLIQGTPSQRSVIYNFQSEMIVRDLMTVLGALDLLDQTGSLIDDGNYVETLKLPLNASASDIQINLIALAQKLDLERGQLATSSDIASATLSNGLGTITFNPTFYQYRQFQPGDQIYLNNFVVSGGAANQINGPQTIVDVDIAQGVAQDATITVNNSLVNTATTASYFLINSAQNVNQYYIWYYESGTSTTDPGITGKIGIKVTLPTGFTAADVAANTATALNQLTDFTALASPTDVTITNTKVGACSAPLPGTTSFTVVVNDTGVDGSTITFNTPSPGTVLSTLNANIESGWFRGIEQPPVPNAPATHSDTQGLQNYLASIIAELQSTNNVREIAKNDGSGTASPLEITTVGIVATTVTINNDVAGDARNFALAGDLLFLDGTWEDTVATSFAGVQTVTGTVNATDFEITVAGLVGPTATIDSTSNVSRILRFTDDLRSAYIDNLNITTTANVDVTIDIPSEVTLNDFYQIYRSGITTAATTDVLSDLTPNDEMKLVYENFPTQAQLDARTITVTDVVPDSFIQGTTNLYTNQFSGETILQANDKPPVAHDINMFKGYTFFSNTRTLFRMPLALLGVSNIIADYDNGLNPSITITDGLVTNTYRFVKGQQEITQVTVNTVLETGAAPGTYFLLNSGNDIRQYYVWYQELGSMTTDPMVAGRTAIKVTLPSGFTTAQVASFTSDSLNQLPDDFSAVFDATSFTVTNVQEGPAVNADAGTSTFGISVTTDGAGENIKRQVMDVTVPAGSLFPAAGPSAYFELYTPFERDMYYVWFQCDSSVDPVVAGRTGIEVTITSLDTDAQVATALEAALSALTTKFTTSINSNVVTITEFNFGPTQDISPATATGSMAGVTGYSAVTTTEGALDILLSNVVSPSLSVDITSNSLVRVINQNLAEIVNAFYVSDVSSTPGNFILESKNISSGAFYILANQTLTGNTFSPSIAPAIVTNSGFNTAANPTVVTAANHGFINGDQVVISGSMGSTPNINGLYTVSNVTTNTFTIPVNVLAVDANPANVKGSVIKATQAEIADNEVKQNRIYYSKYQQPEAVPVVNYIDVGAQNKAITRIFPLRDSLFIFKEDGLYRLSGESAPFTVALFDSSCLLIAPDSVDVSNNLLYTWTRQGISTVSEAGVLTISRSIDTTILKLNDFTYPKFGTATWGMGYESDNSYTVFTVVKPSDTVAKIGYRYSTLTKTWTTVEKSYTCGRIKKVQDRIYTGAGDTNFLEVERKNFDRTDYADRQYSQTLTTAFVLNGNTLTINGQVFSVGLFDNIHEGDVIFQDQFISIYDYNSLLRKLDLDTGPADSDYLSTLEAVAGDSMRNKLEQLAAKLDADPNLTTATFFTNADVNIGTETFNITAHGFANNTPLTFSGPNLPAPIIAGDTYYVINSAANSFQISTTYGGGALNLTTTGGAGPNFAAFNQYTQAIVNKVDFPITSNAVGDPSVVTSAGHQLQTSRYIEIRNVTNSLPTINGKYTATNVSGTQFSVPVNVLTAGTGGTFTTLVTSFEDIKSCFNIIVDILNDDPRIDFSNYRVIEDNTIQEAIITSVNNSTKQITLNVDLPFVLGPITIFNSIATEVEYGPQTMGDPIGLKHIREATVMFENKTFTTAKLSFASDLLPEYIEIPFNGLGNGIFGHIKNFGDNYFGGDSHSAPFRTYIPRQCQRCRFLRIKYNHNIAREKWSIFGYTLTGGVSQSSRAYR